MLPRQKKVKNSAKDTPLDQGVLPDLIGYQLRRAQFVVFSDFQKTLAERYVTPGQYGVLTLIGKNPGLTQSALSRAIGIERSTMVAVIDKLEGANFVERRPSPSDRRSYALMLTEEGEKVMADIEPLVERQDNSISEILGPEDKAKLLELLTRLCDNM
ncbi:MAG: MarR family transcriptional regulator [Alphaproteobacteria bacterium]|nr:MarR family transcriptional regulator [Rhodospirillales bacterium]MCW9046386.1 MarR family transcriptional regulator [Alphaproteobacteria bacterium]